MEELTGTVVLVNPALPYDPDRRQGQLGVIATSDLGVDEIQIGFGNGPVGIYASDALLVLKPHHQLYQDILTNVRELDSTDLKNLLKISILIQDSPNPKQLREALELSMSSPTALAYSTLPLNVKLGIIAEQHQQLKLPFGR
jgi:hypothetical protein